MYVHHMQAEALSDLNSETGVTGSCESWELWEPNQDPLQESKVLLTQ